MGGLSGRAVVDRMTEVLASRRATESELRDLLESADGLVRALAAQVAGSERRLTELTERSAGPLTEIASELHRIDTLRPQLEEARTLATELEERARELRTRWLLRDADSPRRPFHAH